KHTPDPFDEQYQPTILNGGEGEEGEYSAVGASFSAPAYSSQSVDSSFNDGERHHEAGKRDVEMYIRTYNTLLRSSGEISLKALVQAHYNIDSSLHPDARSPYPDMSAFIYSVLRLPTS